MTKPPVQVSEKPEGLGIPTGQRASTEHCRVSRELGPGVWCGQRSARCRMWADCPEQGCEWTQGTHKPSSDVTYQGSDGLIRVRTLALRWHIGKYITGNHRLRVKRKGFGQVTGGKAHHRKGTAVQNLVTGPRWLPRRCRALLALISAPPWGRERETASPLSFN